ncbi:MAG: 4Fe-4S dicluster domain-containing protein [Coriobacteriales bacterium]|jgi:anaerobic dimethyl sulfoxide reductase subunit B (iron-sulfur subunit)|nr:4Fe-4S dicluster domain-containing protein [Coriobacteriales bacterium]
MATQMSFLLDQKWCIGCQTCVTACQMRHRCPDEIQVRRATTFERQLIGPWISVACNHCEAPACLSACPVGAIVKREDGIVVQDDALCIGCKMCITACPYEHPVYVDETSKVLRCDMCAARLDKGDVPACVESCPTKILTVDTLENNEAAGGIAEGVGFVVEPTGPTTRFIPIS